ncbi:MAG: M48 family metalloprotease [Planctomycetes bacterium]|nr:M48 family metalloprotease [Planctomycetota bacterium]
MNNKLLTLIAVFFASHVLSGCFIMDWFTKNVLGVEDLTPANEYYIGRSAQVHVLTGQPAGATDVRKMHPDVELQQYINTIGNYIAVNSTPQFRPEERLGANAVGKWYFTVVESPEVNAFALPGGFILITTGMLKTVKNEDELACILGHEITHVEKRHAIDAIQSGRTIAAYVELATKIAQASADQPIDPEILNFFGECVTGVAGTIVNGWPAEKEFEADHEGLVVAGRAGNVNGVQQGYYTRAMLDYLTRIKTTLESGAGMMDFMGTGHGSPDERIAKVKEFIEGPEAPPTSAQVNYVGQQRYQYFIGKFGW